MSKYPLTYLYTLSLARHCLPRGKNQSPGPFLFNIARKTTFSCLFISTFVWIITQSLCVSTNGYSHFKLRLSTPKWYAVFGALTSLSLLWEEPHRRGELGLYCAPKALASVWFVLRAKGLVPQIPWGEVLLAIMGTASLMHCYVHSPEKMPSLARGVIGQLVVRVPSGPIRGPTVHGSID